MNVHPKFAIVRLRPQDDVFTLFRLLIQHGYPEVSFVNGLREEAFLPRTSLLPSGERITPPPVDAAQSPAAVNAAGANGRPSGEHKGAAMTKDGGGIAMPSTVPTTVSAPLASLGLLGATGSFMSPLSGLPMTSEAQSSFAALANPSMFSSLTGVPTDLSGLLSAPLQLNGGGSNGNGSHSNGLSSMLQQPPSSQSPHNGSPSSTSTANTQLRQRGSRAQTDDPSVYAHCRLCQNKIMASRLSNLTNHVRRHASLKQFQCNYCDYTHNEMAKVRLHMLHNHKDKDSQPIDNLSPEMQAQWDFLMEQCFPQYNKDFFTKETGAHPAVVSSAMRISQVNIPTVTPSLSDLQRHYLKPTTQKVVAKTLSNSSEQLDEAHGLTCIECGELVSEQLLEHHLRHSHAADCIPYVCDECGYENSDQWKVRLHISLKHAEKAADIAVTAQNTANNYAAFISKFFPDYEHDNGMDDDDDLLASLKKEVTEPAISDVISNGSANAAVRSSTVDPEENLTGVENLRCELCRKMMVGCRPLSSLLNHAKRHYHMKQFQCRQCSYCSSEAAHVRSHMKLKHRLVGEPPLDNKNANLQAAWMQIMTRCFPEVAPKLGKFRFKNFRGKPGRPRLYPKRECRETDGSDQSGEIRPAADTHIKCRLCSKMVAAADMSTHAGSHVPLKPYGCSVCHYRTAEYQQLRVHLLKHKSSGERPRPVARQDNHALRNQYVKYCFGIVQ